MRFKMTSKNPFRNFVRNLRRITISKHSIEEKDILYHDLWNELSLRLSETERYLTSSPAFSSRCEYWNYVKKDSKVISITPVTNIKNPYLQIKREFVDAIITCKTSKDFVRAVSKSLMWFHNTPYKDDWVT